ncbi:MAG: hypothetical protein ACI9P7_000913 [Candidatus Azotimanducaceae bacterium]|jgi:hypothetical protein
MANDDTINIHCQCGALSLRVKGPPIVQLVCHCRDCKEATNLPYIECAFFESTACSSQGSSTLSAMKGSSGYDKSYFSCESCRTTMYARVNALNGAWAVVANQQASFTFEPEAHIWTSEKASDVSIPESAVQSSSGPPEDIRALMISTFWGKR